MSDAVALRRAATPTGDRRVHRAGCHRGRRTGGQRRFGHLSISALTARELTRSFVDPDFAGFERRHGFPLKSICMTQYDAKMPNVQVCACRSRWKTPSADAPRRSAGFALRKPPNTPTSPFSTAA